MTFYKAHQCHFWSLESDGKRWWIAGDNLAPLGNPEMPWIKGRWKHCKAAFEALGNRKSNGAASGHCLQHLYELGKRTVTSD